MSDRNRRPQNWFLTGGKDYALYRPKYPSELSAVLAEFSRDRKSALDVGCGNGQLTCLLAEHFSFVKGTDPSAEQISNATPHERVRYECAAAEHLPSDNKTFSLITAAQAAHWFRLDEFYSEVRRVAAPDALLALISYGVMQLDNELHARFINFYTNEIGPFWPPERRLVDNGYRDIDFPFTEVAIPELSISYEWPLKSFLGYISTWSAVARARKSGREEVFDQFCSDIVELWGNEEQLRPISWPVTVRAGRVK